MQDKINNFQLINCLTVEIFNFSFLLRLKLRLKYKKKGVDLKKKCFILS